MMKTDISPCNVSIVLLNYRNAVDTIACLQAIHAMPEPPLSIIVVDGCSGDGSPDQIASAWNGIAEPVTRVRYGEPSGISISPFLLLEMPENNGYAVGNNAGIRLALEHPACRAVWVLNNDTEPEQKALEALCRRLREVPQAGLAGSTLVFSHARDTVQCAGGFCLTRWTGAASAVYGEEPLSSVTPLTPESVEHVLDYLCGASMLVRREVFASAGFFPEEYFLYYEDAAFCLNAQRVGHKLVWAPDSIVFHKEGGSTGAESTAAGRTLKRSAAMDYLALRNRIYFIRTYFPFFCGIAALSYAGVALNRLKRGQAKRIPLVLRALCDGLLGRMGKGFLSVFFKKGY